MTLKLILAQSVQFHYNKFTKSKSMVHREWILCQLNQEKHKASRANMSYKKWLIIATSLFGAGFILGLVTPTGIFSFGPFASTITGLEELANFLVSLPQFAILVIIFITNVSTLLHPTGKLHTQPNFLPVAYSGFNP